MTDTIPRERFASRAEIRDVELTDERIADLKRAFEQTEPAERINNAVAATFEIDGDISDTAVVISSSLHHDRIFELVASSARGSPEHDADIYASATVVDEDSGEYLATHVSQDKILISRKHADVGFEAFRDYVLYLENALHINLNPL